LYYYETRPTIDHYIYQYCYSSGTRKTPQCKRIGLKSVFDGGANGGKSAISYSRQAAVQVGDVSCGITVQFSSH
jgi:hypothetical protein